MKKGKDYIGVGGGCLILNDKKEILLIRRADKVRNEAGWWSKPGGGIKFGEKAEEAMIREMKEELGIEVEIVGWLPHTDHIMKTPQNSHSSNFDPLYTGGEGDSQNSYSSNFYPFHQERGEQAYTGGEKVEHWVALNFIAKIVKGEPKNMEPHKCDKVAWFPLNELPEKITQTTKEPVENYLKGKYVKLI